MILEDLGTRPDLALAIAERYEDLQQPENARQMAELALTRASQPEIVVQLAKVVARSGEHRRAFEILRELALSNSDSDVVQFNLAFAAALVGEDEVGLQAASRVKGNSEYERAVGGLIIALFIRLGRYKEAVALPISDDMLLQQDARYAQAFAWSRLGDFNRAFSVMKEFSQADLYSKDQRLFLYSLAIATGSLDPHANQLAVPSKRDLRKSIENLGRTAVIVGNFDAAHNLASTSRTMGISSRVLDIVEATSELERSNPTQALKILERVPSASTPTGANGLKGTERQRVWLRVRAEASIGNGEAATQLLQTLFVGKARAVAHEDRSELATLFGDVIRGRIALHVFRAWLGMWSSKDFKGDVLIWVGALFAATSAFFALESNTETRQRYIREILANIENSEGGAILHSLLKAIASIAEDTRNGEHNAARRSVLDVPAEFRTMLVSVLTHAEIRGWGNEKMKAWLNDPLLLPSDYQASN
jgi:tetratricopeptide (TPR) repeat protein